MEVVTSAGPTLPRSVPIAADLARVWVTVALALVTVLGIGSITVIGLGRLSDAEDAAMRAEAATAVTVALRRANLALQDERAAAEHLADAPSGETARSYLATQDATDGALDELERVWVANSAVVGDSDPPTLADILDGAALLPQLRESVAGGSEESSVASYGGVIEVITAATRRREAAAAASAVGPQIRALVRVVEAGEALSEQRDLVFDALAAGRPLTQDELIQVAQLDQLVRTNLGSIRLITVELGTRVNAFLTAARVDAAQEAIDTLLGGGTVASEAWYDAATARLDSLRSVGDDLERSLLAAVGGLASSASQRRAIGSAALVILTGFSVLAGLGAVAAARQRAVALREHGDLAAGLQRWFSADQLADVSGVRVAARYDAVSAFTRAGGDWYDAYALDATHVAITVGDVAGHGATATAHMAMVRNLLRGITLADPGSPGAQLGILDRAMRGTDTMATVFHGILDLAAGELVYSRAGHPVGLIRHEGTVGLLEEALGSPVGVGSEAGYVDATVRLDPGCQIVVFTDGLVEVRGEDVERAIEVVAKRLADAPEAVEEVADLLIGGREGRQDDTALLVVSCDSFGRLEQGAYLVQ